MEIVKTNLTDQVYEYIQLQISKGIWKPGEKIPSEIELAKELNISRMSLRTGIQKANLMGITETRVGEGTFVKEFTMRPFLETLYKSDLLDVSDEKIQEMREVLQIGSVRIALNSENIDKEVKELEEIYHQMEQVFDPDNFAPFHELDAQFHRKICQLCHNEILYMIYDAMEYLVNEISKQNVVYSVRHHNDRGVFLMHYHKELLNSIKARDVDRFIANINLSREDHKHYKLFKEAQEVL